MARLHFASSLVCSIVACSILAFACDGDPSSTDDPEDGSAGAPALITPDTGLMSAGPSDPSSDGSPSDGPVVPTESPASQPEEPEGSTAGGGGTPAEPPEPDPEPEPMSAGGDGGGASPNSDAGAMSSEGGSSGASSPPESEPPGCIDFALPVEVGEFDESQLDQLSGLVASRSQPGVLYAHLDAGAAPVLFVSDLAGASLGTIVLDGTETTDWEDIAVSPPADDGTSWIYIGDIGDNAARTGGTPRTELAVLRLPEPAAPSDGSEISVSDWERVIVVYPEEAHDAESLMYDPVSGDLLIVTKETDGLSGVYRMPASAPADETVTLEWIADVTIGQSGQEAQASAGDISSSGDRILVRNYANALLWPRAPGQSIADALASMPVTLETADEPQSEGITFSADGGSWLSAGEQVLSLYRADATCD